MIKTYAEILDFGIEMDFSYSWGDEGDQAGGPGDPGGLWNALKGDQAAFPKVDFDAMVAFVVDSGPDLGVDLVKNLVSLDPHVG